MTIELKRVSDINSNLLPLSILRSQLPMKRLRTTYLDYLIQYFLISLFHHKLNRSPPSI